MANGQDDRDERVRKMLDLGTRMNRLRLRKRQWYVKTPEQKAEIDREIFRLHEERAALEAHHLEAAG